MNKYWPHNYVYFSVFPHVPRFWLDFFLLFCQLFDASKAYFFTYIANFFYYIEWVSGPNYLDNNIAIYGNLPQSVFFFFFFKSIWLSRVLVVALEIFIVSCGIFCWGTWILQLWCRLSNCGAWTYLPHCVWDLISLTKDCTYVPCLASQILNHWTTREVPPVKFLISLLYFSFL